MVGLETRWAFRPSFEALTSRVWVESTGVIGNQKDCQESVHMPVSNARKPAREN